MENIKNFTSEDIKKMTDENYKLKMSLPEDYEFLSKEALVKNLLEIIDDNKVIGFPNMDIASYLVALLLSNKEEMKKRHIVRFELKNSLSLENLVIIANPIIDPFGDDNTVYINHDIIHSANRDILYEQFKLNIMDNLMKSKEEHTDNE